MQPDPIPEPSPPGTPVTFPHNGEQVNAVVIESDRFHEYARDDRGKLWFAPLGDWEMALPLPPPSPSPEGD